MTIALETLLSTEIPSESLKDRWNYVLNGTFPNIFYSVVFFQIHICQGGDTLHSYLKT